MEHESELQKINKYILFNDKMPLNTVSSRMMVRLAENSRKMSLSIQFDQEIKRWKD